MDLEQIRTETNKTIVELLSTPYSNITFIERKEAIMQAALDAAEEPHPAPIVALTQAKIMLGKTEEAVELANRVWEMGGAISKTLETLYVYQLNSLGLFQKSLVILKPKISLYASARAETEGFKQAILKCAVGLGDLDLIGKISSLEEFTAERYFLETFVQQMDKAMMKQHFQAQQEMINKVVMGKQAGYEVMLGDENGYPEIEVGIFVGGDSVDRYQLQKQLDEDYAEYYIENKINPLDNFIFSIFDIREHWALEQ